MGEREPLAQLRQRLRVERYRCPIRLSVRTIRLDPVSRFLYWFMSYHTGHHMDAAVPCYNLPRLSREIAHDMPEPRPLRGASLGDLPPGELG